MKGVWLHYASLGGCLSEYELDAYINEAFSLSDGEHDMLAEAINELIDMRPSPPRALFSSEPAFADVERLAPDDF